MHFISNVFFLCFPLLFIQTYCLGSALTITDLKEEEQRFMTLLHFLYQISKKTPNRPFYLDPEHLFRPMMSCIYPNQINFAKSIQEMDRVELYFIKNLLSQNETLLEKGTFPAYSANRWGVRAVESLW